MVVEFEDGGDEPTNDEYPTQKETTEEGSM
jgi:hypothetical protein